MFPKMFPAIKPSGFRPGLYLLCVVAGGDGRHPARRHWMCAVLYVAGGSLLLALALLGLILQGEPLLAPNPHPAQHYLQRTRSLLHATVQADTDPATQKQLALTADDLTAVANFALLRKKLPGRAECAIEAGRLILVASIRLRLLGFEPFLNITLVADDAHPQAIIKRLQLGRLNLPDPLVGWLLGGVLHHTPLARYSRVGEQLIRQVRIQDDGRLAVVLNWNRDVLGRAEGLITDLADKERLLVYRDKLAEVVGQAQMKRFVRLGLLTQPLFALAKTRSEQDNDPVAENRALILVLGAYVGGKNLGNLLLPVTAGSAQPAQRGVLLNRRIDTAQHFVGSAALTLSGHNTLADMIGLAKEMNDTHNGSGFSFVDLAADQAGVLFGKMAVRSEETARKAQEILGQSADESVFMPAIKDLPENLNPVDFAERFKDIDSPEFQALKSQIEARILACPLYRP